MRKGKNRAAALAAAALLLALCAACAADGKLPPSPAPAGDAKTSGSSVEKQDCNTVFAQIVAVNGDKLTVSAGDQVLALTVDSKLLLDWEEDEAVILFFTGSFGEDMQVHYIEKWTENSEVQPPADKSKEARAEKGGSVVGG